MLFDIVLYDGSTLEGIDGAPDPVGITYQETSSIIIPGQEDEMKMIMIPWAAISRIEYVVTPDMIAPEEVQPNRKARRSALQ